MKITKYAQSCLLVENIDKVILIDPGRYSFEQGLFNSKALSRLDLILITHEHSDHCHIPFIQEVRKQFTDVPILSNSSVVDKLKAAGILANNEVIDTKIAVGMEVVQHEKIWKGIVPPLNSIFTVFNRLTHPGDYLGFRQCSQVLALPMQGSWTSTARAFDHAVTIRPEKIIPIHDWHWKDEVREEYYRRAVDFFGKEGIEFISVKDGEAMDV